MSSVIVSYVLFALAIITALAGLRIINVRGKKKKIDYVSFGMCASSSWWCFFWAMLFAQTEAQKAWLMRSIGMVGVFAYLFFVSYIIVLWSGVQGIWAKYMLGFAALGILIYPLNIRKNNSQFYMTEIGMSYEFNGNIGNQLYSVFCMIILVNLVISLVYMWKQAVRRREKRLAINLMVCAFIVGFGSLADTIMPMFGFAAFPGSTLGQALGTVVLYQAYVFYNKSQITLSNISKFIYYSVDEPILLFDEKEKLCIVNNGTAIFLERTIEECCALKIEEIFELKQNVFRLKGDKSRVEARCILNQSICNLAIDKIYDEFHEIIGYIIIVHDMTERIHTMHQLEEEKLRADKANEAKSLFLANMSHEIRTPINAIMGMNEMVLRESEEEETIECSNNIQNASKTLLALINDILDFSKIESGKMEIVEEAYSVKSIFTNLYTECQIRTEEKGLYLRFEIPEDLPSILCGDEVRIRQIILNILSNAIKYTKKGGVTLSVTWKRLEGKQIKLQIAVEDTGIGIKEENMDKLFGAFDRVDEERVHTIEGTGLGLSIVRRLIDLMNGEITIASEYGKGSVFTVTLEQRIISEVPMGDFLNNAVEETRKKYKPSFRAPKAKVLVVDDNKVNLTVIKGLLKQTDMQITCVMSGEECLALTAKEKYHIVLLDHMMPEMDGIETLIKMKEDETNQCKDTAIIALTANAIVGVKNMYLKKGFTDYIAKPVEGLAMEKVLKQYLPEELIEELGEKA